MDNHFSIVITAFNCGPWVKQNISSVLSQDYSKYDIYYVDDFSQDDTKHQLQAFKGERIIPIFNNHNKGKMKNLIDVNSQLKSDTIIVVLDGDDWLHDNGVLGHLNDVYNDERVWMTNGSYIVKPSNEIVKPKIDPEYWNGHIRKKSWEFSHLGTFRKPLFDKIKKRDLMDKQGNYWSTTSDQAIMWPMVEMCGPEHHHVIERVMYVYNRMNPISDDRINRIDQLQTEKTIREMKPYERLDSL